ncbi:MAG TPA: hypothetical protein VGQ99_13215, partial [Tepidisphaeraceae bacterium]|nr:hypothetical protein [Tepidisphaeraceae bacterium]
RRVLGVGVGQLAAIDSGGFDIYYNADAEENGYLNGMSYQLAGGGWLRPSYAGEALAGAGPTLAGKPPVARVGCRRGRKFGQNRSLSHSDRDCGRAGNENYCTGARASRSMRFSTIFSRSWSWSWASRFMVLRRTSGCSSPRSVCSNSSTSCHS